MIDRPTIKDIIEMALDGDMDVLEGLVDENQVLELLVEIDRLRDRVQHLEEFIALRIDAEATFGMDDEEFTLAPEVGYGWGPASK